MTPDTRTTENPEPRRWKRIGLGSIEVCIACDHYLQDGNCPIHGDLTQRAESAQGAAPRAEGLPSVEDLAEALKAEGFVRGVASRYGRLNDPYWTQSAEAILARLSERRDKEGTE